MLWALDRNVFIYALNGHPEFASHARELLKKVNDYQPAVASYLLVIEVMRREKPIVFEAIEATANLSFKVIDRPVSLKAAELLAEYDSWLKPFDAVHIATAIVY